MAEGYTLVDLESSPYDKPEKIEAELERIELQIERRGLDEGLRMARETLKNWLNFRLEQDEIAKSSDPLDIAT